MEQSNFLVSFVQLLEREKKKGGDILKHVGKN